MNSARHARMRRRWRQPGGRGGSIMAAGSADAVKQLAADESPMIMMLKSVSAVE